MDLLKLKYMVKALKDKNSQIVIDNQKFKKVSSNPLDIVYKEYSLIK